MSFPSLKCKCDALSLIRRRQGRFSSFFRKVAAALLIIVTASLSKAQAPPLQVLSVDAQEAAVFRLLFRQAWDYERLANEAEATGAPRPYLRQILQHRLNLSDHDAVNLLLSAQGYHEEDASIRQAIAEEKTAERSDFPLGLKPAGMSLHSSASLDRLHVEEDALVLRFRDLLRNQLDTAAFQRLHAQLFLHSAQFNSGPAN